MPGFPCTNLLLLLHGAFCILDFRGTVWYACDVAPDDIKKRFTRPGFDVCVFKEPHKATNLVVKLKVLVSMAGIGEVQSPHVSSFDLEKFGNFNYSC